MSAKSPAKRISSNSPPFHFAIVGGGIAGCLMSISLLKHKIPHTLYESASNFGEIGAGIGFQPNFVRTMALISPHVREAFLRCADEDDEESTIWFKVRVGDARKAPQDDNVISSKRDSIMQDDPFFEWPGRPGPKGGVHRAHFLEELVKMIPKDVTRFRKRLVDVTEADDGSGESILHFADRTTARHSAVIGCDGIKSKTREVLLGKEEAMPIFSGKYAYRGLISMQNAVELMGEKQPREPQMFCGYQGHVLTFPIAKGTILNVVAFSSQNDWTSAEWVKETSRESMLEDYAGWGPTVQAIIASMQNTDVWALFNHRPARTYCQSHPRICLVGDAAHASTPHQGAGAGMCVEDVYILGELLAMASTSEDLEKVFQAYDTVRRPRTQKLVETSREGALLYEFEGPDGDDLEAITKNMSTRMDWIWDADLVAELEKARLLVRGETVPIPSPRN